LHICTPLEEVEVYLMNGTSEVVVDTMELIIQTIQTQKKIHVIKLTNSSLIVLLKEDYSILRKTLVLIMKRVF
jgi:hypothetical protein